MRLINSGRDVPAAPSSDGFFSASRALTESPDDDAAAPPSTVGESSSGTYNQRPGTDLAGSVPGAHAGASDTDFSTRTGATCTARAPVFRVSFRFRVLNVGGCNCCCCQRGRPAGSCVPVPGRITPPELVAGREEPLRARPPNEPRPPAPPRPSSVSFRLTRRTFVFLVVS